MRYLGVSVIGVVRCVTRGVSVIGVVRCVTWGGQCHWGGQVRY